MRKLVCLILLMPCALMAQEYAGPIFDVHLHGYTENSFRPFPGGPMTFDAFKAETNALIEKYNYVGFMKSGGMFDDDIEEMALQGYQSNNLPKFDTVTFKQMIAEGKVDVWGEFIPSFNGLTIADPGFAPYLKICEREGIPIGLHTGGGPPGISQFYKKYSTELGDPYYAEEILIKYPKLKIYFMHAGVYFYENVLALMEQYPQVYADIGAIIWVDNGRTGLIAEEFLRLAQRSGYLDRVMFGSDGMVPQHIARSIDRLNGFEFLSLEEKQMIFHDNAMRFFGLKD